MVKLNITIEAETPTTAIEELRAFAASVDTLNPSQAAQDPTATPVEGKRSRGKKDTTPAPAATPDQQAPAPAAQAQPAAIPQPAGQPQVPPGWPMTPQQFGASQQAAANILTGAYVQPGAFPGVQPQSALPQGGPPQYTYEQLANAAGPLVMAGRQPELQQMLQQFGVGQLQDIPVARLGEVANYLRSLGAQI